MLARLCPSAATIGLVFQFRIAFMEPPPSPVRSGRGCHPGGVRGLPARVVLPLGSAVAIGNLAAAGVWTAAPGAAYILLVILFSFVMPASLTGVPITFGLVLTLPYALAWIPIGVSLIHGVPARTRSENRATRG